MNKQTLLIPISLKAFGLFVLMFLSPQVLAFNSGSTGADGVLAPTADTTLPIPADGILNYTTVNIPTGVSVKFSRNAANTPVYILVQGDAVIDGTIDMSGVDGSSLGSPPPGAFEGGIPQASNGGNGKGPGGSSGGTGTYGANGGSYATQGNLGRSNGGNSTLFLGSVYGSTSLQPLLGGSGGGATRSTDTITGDRGGSGGGAILLAVTGTLTLNGEILVNGGNGAPIIESGGETNWGSGGGSGGAVRIIASTFTGSGNIDFSGGAKGEGDIVNSIWRDGGAGGNGRARLEADVFNFTGTSTPNAISAAAPSPVFASNLPTIQISTIAGLTVPAVPTGENDVVLPTSTANPATITFTAANVPLGSTVELTVTPVSGGTVTTATSSALTGTLASSTASVDVTLPDGASTLQASVSFAVVTASIFDMFTNGEMVASVTVTSEMGSGSSSIKLTTESGKVIQIPYSAISG